MSTKIKMVPKLRPPSDHSAKLTLRRPRSVNNPNSTVAAMKTEKMPIDTAASALIGTTPGAGPIRQPNRVLAGRQPNETRSQQGRQQHPEHEERQTQDDRLNPVVQRQRAYVEHDRAEQPPQ